MATSVPREVQAELNRRADLLSSLLRHPGWQQMEAEIDRKVERLKRTATNVALAQGGADQSKLDTIRGTIAALMWMKGVPRHAENTLLRFLQEQGFEEDEIPEED
ncbi:MAG TPA: hypothetical protein VFE93_06410 [Myxococcaceae bacterium]|nr:hypothetical protein [Myxococcaceae bacterium]